MSASTFLLIAAAMAPAWAGEPAAEEPSATEGPGTEGPGTEVPEEEAPAEEAPAEETPAAQVPIGEPALTTPPRQGDYRQGLDDGEAIARSADLSQPLLVGAGVGYAMGFAAPVCGWVGMGCLCVGFTVPGAYYYTEEDLIPPPMRLENPTLAYERGYLTGYRSTMSRRRGMAALGAGALGTVVGVGSSVAVGLIVARLGTEEVEP